MFVTRCGGAEVLLVHRSPEQGGYWHVVAGGVESGEAPGEAAQRELREETGLVAEVIGGIDAVEYAYPLTEEPPARRNLYDPSVERVVVTCFRAVAPDDWEPTLDWEHDGYRWCDARAAFETLRWPETAQALRELVPFDHPDPAQHLVEVRVATTGDADGIADVQERTWQAAYRHVFPARELDRGGFIRPERWRGRVAKPPAGWTTFVAVDEGIVAGFAAVGPSRDERGVGELYAIYVEPERWSTGLGRLLIEQCEEQLRGSFSEATLWVLEDNPRARAFYERAGWSPDGGRKSEERWGVRAPEVRYRKTLRGV